MLPTCFAALLVCLSGGFPGDAQLELSFGIAGSVGMMVGGEILCDLIDMEQKMRGKLQ